MPGNAITRKTDEVEKLIFSGVSTENTITVMILTFMFAQICLGKQCRPRSDCF